MAENSNRTQLCGVLCVDIAGFSQRNVAEQIRLKERFNAALTEAIAGVARNDRVILDTGGGAEVSFLASPEHAMSVGVRVRDALAVQGTTPGSGLCVRFGVNLGPVQVVKDINGRPSAMGDGIDVARRIMNFAECGQILVHRDYCNFMVGLSGDYAHLFDHKGPQTGAHMREHGAYAVSPEASSVFRRQGVKTGSTTTIGAWMRNLFR